MVVSGWSSGSFSDLVVSCWSPSARGGRGYFCGGGRRGGPGGRGCPGRRGLDTYAGMVIRVL